MGDLARRLAGQKLLGGTDPGAAEALERLLDAVLRCTFDVKCSDVSHTMLALHFVVNCFAWEHLREPLLPVVGQLIRTGRWADIWSASSAHKSQEAAAALLLNSSIVLRSACCRVEQAGILKASIDALHRMPENAHLNLAIGNLLVIGGEPEDAKRVLQAQPLPSLRPLAAALFRGELDGQPEGRAFPGAWKAEASTSGTQAEPGSQGSDEPRLRRPPRAAIPARHRRMRRGG